MRCEIEHGTLALVEFGAAVVHHHVFAQHGVATQHPHGSTVGHQAIEALVFGGHHNSDHLAFQFAEFAFAEHQFVVEPGKALKLLQILAVRGQHVGDHAEFFLADLEVLLGVFRHVLDLGDREIQGDDVVVMAH